MLTDKSRTLNRKLPEDKESPPPDPTPPPQSLALSPEEDKPVNKSLLNS